MAIASGGGSARVFAARGEAHEGRRESGHEQSEDLRERKSDEAFPRIFAHGFARE